MIKKISRPKQVNNQDKQAPKTIQELMQRYDLDNKGVCDYLDYLIEYLIQQKQEIEDNKVSKNGDTMTGDLILDNERYLKGIDKNGNSINLIRAHNSFTAIGDSEKETRIWSSVIPTVVIAKKAYEILLSNKYYTNGTEYKTGEYINNKPVYKRYLEGILPAANSTVVLISDVEKLVNYNIIVKRKGINQCHLLNYGATEDAGHISSIFHDTSANTICVYVKNTIFTEQDYSGFIEYIKK